MILTASLKKQHRCESQLYVLSYTGGSYAGGGRINTPSPEAAMPEVDEKNKPTG